MEYYVNYTAPWGRSESKSTPSYDEGMQWLLDRINAFGGYQEAYIIRGNDDNSEEIVCSFRSIR